MRISLADRKGGSLAYAPLAECKSRMRRIFKRTEALHAMRQDRFQHSTRFMLGSGYLFYLRVPRCTRSAAEESFLWHRCRFRFTQ